MRRKVFSMVTTMALFIVFMGLAFISTAISEETAPDPSALIGRWEGSARGLDDRWTSYYAFEIFYVDVGKKRVYGRRICPECGRAGMFYETYKLNYEKDKIGFETTWRDPLTIVLKGNYLSGFLSSTSGTGGIYRYDYTLKRVAEGRKAFEPKELIGEWMWVEDRNWFDITITEVDSQNKTFKGKYKIGRDKTDYELSNAKLITEGDKLKIDFKTINDTLHYQLTYYPNFGEYPPVLWGKLERLDGNVFYPMFRKKEKKE